MQELVREYLNELGEKQKKRRRVRMIAAVFAVIVIGSVAWSLIQSGIAMTGQAKCGMEEHTHGDGCYSNTLACGQEESAGHTHGEACYQTTQNLICGQEESEEHAHSEACYQTEQTLICGQEEAAGHTHADACYSRQLSCGKQEHIHTDACFVDNNADVEDASKWDAQYADIEWKDAWGEDLVIAAKEQLDYKESVDNYIVGEDGSHKGYTRYGQFAGESYIDWDMAFVNFCMHYAGLDESKMFPEEKTTKEWYDKFVEADEGKNKVYLTTPEGYEPKEGDLIFTKRENEETELQAGIISSYDKEKNEIKVIEGNSENRVKENTYAIDDKYISEYLMIGEMEKEYKKQDNETAVGTTDETETDGEEPTVQTEIPAGSIEKVYTDGTIIVRASYEADAEIPEEAELIAEQITAEGNEEHYAEREAEFRETLENDEAVMKALLKIGFYVNGEEVEPKSTVTITVQFLDENGLAEGKPVTIVHFADKGAEVLDGSKANNNSTTFQTESFSEFAIGEEAEAIAKGETFPINKKFEYEDEMFRINFSIVGNASAKAVEKEEAESDEVAEEVNATDLAEEGESKYQLKVRVLDEDSEAYQQFAKYSDEMDNGGERLTLQAMSYALFFEDTELDLTDCEVTIAITPTKKMNKEAQALMDEADGEDKDENNEDDKQSAIRMLNLETKIEPVFGNADREEAENVLDGLDLYDGEANNANVLKPEDLTGQGVVVSALEMGTKDAESTNTVNEMGNAVIPKDMSYSAVPTVYFTSTSDTFAPEASNIANTPFQVEYYAELERIATQMPEGKEEKDFDSLLLIDTSGGKLPQNGLGMSNSPVTGNDFKKVYVEKVTGSSTVKKTLLTEKKFTQIYQTRDYSYWRAPSINYFNSLIQNSNYVMKAVWVYNEGTSKTGKIICGEEHTHEAKCYKDNWDEYTDLENLHFSNRNLGSPYIYIKKGAVIRLIYDAAPEKKIDIDTAFYDYDLSDGKIYSTVDDARNQKNGKATSQQDSTSTWYARTDEQGINNPDNYGKNVGSKAKFAFGNANTGSGLFEQQLGANKINKANTSSYRGCAFGLATGLNEDGKIQYASNIVVPNLFNEGNAIGKSSYDKKQYSLKFNRNGDTYTMTAVNGANLTGLEYFNHPKSGNVIYDGSEFINSNGEKKNRNNIWTNNFWPMDAAPSYGTNTHDMKFGDLSKLNQRRYVGKDANGNWTNATAYNQFPQSDDALDHNAYFGMHYQVAFELSAEYVGPLEYYFFGDDDMWVFLDGELVCDIGGVHSSAGEYVNLWDYIKDTQTYKDMVKKQKDSWESGSDELFSHTYTLSFFYTERGESGSTCWMQFTLPTVTAAKPEPNTDTYGQLKVEKTVTEIKEGQSSTLKNDDQEFTFHIQLEGAKDDYVYKKFRYKRDEDGNLLKDEDGNLIAEEVKMEGKPQLVVHDGSEFTLKNGEYIIVDRIPIGTKYTVTETTERIETGGISYDYETEITQTGGGTGAVIDQEKKQVSGYITKKSDEENDVSINLINQSKVLYNNKFTVYKLPATGGEGIYMYMFSGMLLILGASLMTYRKKCRGVSGS